MHTAYHSAFWVKKTKQKELISNTFCCSFLNVAWSHSENERAHFCNRNQMLHIQLYYYIAYLIIHLQMANTYVNKLYIIFFFFWWKIKQKLMILLIYLNILFIDKTIVHNANQSNCPIFFFFFLSLIIIILFYFCLVSYNNLVVI